MCCRSAKEEPLDYETQMRIKNLSFYDFDDEKSLIETKATPGGMDFGSDTEESEM